MTILGLDHIIFAAPDLQLGLDQIRALTGVEPEPSGSHPGRGTRNALFALGPDTYIEVLAPDPAQSAEALAQAAPRIPTIARITTWAAKCDDLEAAIKSAGQGGLDLGRIEPGSRTLPNNDQLNWRSARGELPGDGLIPFLLDWTGSVNPAPSLPSGCTLRYLRAQHPEPDRIRQYLALLSIQDLLEVTPGPQPRLVAGLSTPNGEVELS